VGEQGIRCGLLDLLNQCFLLAETIAFVGVEGGSIIFLLVFSIAEDALQFCESLGFGLRRPDG
jgi:hypothetical protein